ncbi:SusC/RagA family TonB-linked outer membrane protein [Mucilaginibacter sabulilitoris]|uniref:SusC/RagA family TonB-linked outer membrane protein n=1 Tax=Mucilaginibacter sabulilitoris TaxID=1173583 RepID=A0ABZ0TQU4_9SPHI|nr:SusC/RagA family TonB-linked outer membrane protein [Mucilaginibacter sabulilitoris]WPU94473.1 SusC/RagA family TonB-linked outer membrane protein [Mucilaginibacter sabulilitoris]
MKKLLLASLCVLLLCVTQTFAQNRTVTGTVTAQEDGLPIPGVTVRVKGTTIGTQTGTNGKYTLSVPEGATLIISFIGYAQQEIPVTGSVVNVKLVVSSKQLGEVVVTGALGITRTRNQQSYAAQQVAGEEVNKTRSSNFVTGLSGKVAGLEIRQNNALGSSVNVVLRGVKSITGNNQALFVIDGVPVDNSNLNARPDPKKLAQQDGNGGYDYGSPASDINPDDIESVTVLKGAAASALYGSRGSNGVILITSKKAKKGLGIVINSSISQGSLVKSTFPTYQHSYGAGYGAYYSDPTAHFFYGDVNGDGKPDLVTPTTEDASYGAAFDPKLMVYQWDAFDSTSPNYKKATPWVAAKNDPTSFFEKPISNNQSIMITNGTDAGTFKLGYTRSNENGIVPNSNINKNQVDLAGTYNITSKLTVGGAVNFFNINGRGRPGTGYDGAGGRNVMTNFRQWWEVNNDVQDLKAAYDRTGKNITWNYADPLAGNFSAIFWDNPYYVRYQNYETDTRNRYLGNVNAVYKATDWLTITGRTSLDSYTELDEERKNVTSVGVPYYSRNNRSYTETNYDLLATVDKKLSNSFNLKALLGTNIRKQNIQNIYAITNGGLFTPSLYSIANSLNAPNAPIENKSLREVDGIFAGATLTYNNFLTLDGTIRRDKSSTLPEANNTYYYPSGSLGFVFSELLKQYNWLSYGKLRVNYAQVGSDAPVYSVLDNYTINPPIGSIPQANVNTTKNNPNLKPERTRSTEAGLELAFFNNRLGFDGSYYNTSTFDEILPVNVSTATGYSFSYLNAGTVKNKGVELSLNGTPVSTKDFSWKLTLNFTKNISKVTELFKDDQGQEASNLQLNSYQGGVSINATLNQPFGTIRGTDFIYKDGQRVVGANGQYLQSGPTETIGNANPKWIGGINNSFRYKNFNFSFLIDIRKGGSVFSTDMYYGLATGLYPETVYTNDLGNPVRNTLANGGGFIRPGVTEDGQPNTKRVSASNYGAFGYATLPDKAFVYDAGYVKLREAVLGYTIPENTLSHIGPIKEVTFQVIGRNLWIMHKNLPYADPEEGLSSGNLQGYQVGSYPTTRTISLNLKLRF